MANTEREIDIARSITHRLINAGHMRSSSFTQANRIILRFLADERVFTEVKVPAIGPPPWDIDRGAGMLDAVKAGIEQLEQYRYPPIAAVPSWEDKDWLDAFGLMAEIERDRCWAEAERNMPRPDHITWIRADDARAEAIRDRYRQYGR